MPEWFAPSLPPETGISPQQLLLRLLVSVLFGAGVALVFRLSHGRQKENASTLTATLVLLSVLIAMVSMVIGDSVARAFSLVGALSIVRFRTVVEDTRDTAFVIFAVIVGMAAGAGALWVPVIGLPLVGAVAVAMNRVAAGGATPAAAEQALSIRLGLGRDTELTFQEVFGRHLESWRLVATSTARQGAALDLSYQVRLRTTAGMATLVSELNQIEGVQNVELRA